MIMDFITRYTLIGIGITFIIAAMWYWRVRYGMRKMLSSDNRREEYSENVEESTETLEASQMPDAVEIEAPARGDAQAFVSVEMIRHYVSFVKDKPILIDQQRSVVGLVSFAPKGQRGWWTYATAGLSRVHKGNQTDQESQHLMGIELVLCSYNQEERILNHLAKLVQMLIHQYRSEGISCAAGEIFPLSEGIVDGSQASFLLLTPPYFELEGFEYYVDAQGLVQVLALVPITLEEYTYAGQFGHAALEQRFEEQDVNTLDFYRNSVV